MVDGEKGASFFVVGGGKTSLAGLLNSAARVRFHSNEKKKKKKKIKEYYLTSVYKTLRGDNVPAAETASLSEVFTCWLGPPTMA